MQKTTSLVGPPVTQLGLTVPLSSDAERRDRGGAAGGEGNPDAPGTSSLDRGPHGAASRAPGHRPTPPDDDDPPF
ncbi:hypothetical protein [Sorangium sp. So ce1153]|uniref:hypothetical protein n=1 Tax=Sorangium sp. So ce1153 TaxID=3133333 RepID=UPI003F5DC339